MKKIIVTVVLATLSRVAESVALAEHEKSHTLRAVQSAEANETVVVHNTPEPLVITPVQKVINMLNNLQAKVIKEEKEQWLLYDQETANCKEEHKVLSFLVKKDEMTYDDDAGMIKVEGARLIKCFSRVQQLDFMIAMKNQELKREQKDYANTSAHYDSQIQELEETVTTIRSALEHLEKARDHEPALLQANRTMTLVQALAAMVKASTITSAGADTLMEFAQTQTGSKENGEEDEEDLGSPAQEGYDFHSDKLIETLRDMLQTAESSLDETRKIAKKAEYDHTEVAHAIELEIENLEKELERVKEETGYVEQKKSEFEHDLFGISKTLSIEKEARKMSDAECIAAGEAFTEESKLRKNELEALTKAEGAIHAAQNSSAGLSFMQLSSETTNYETSAVNRQVLEFVRALGHQHHSQALLRLSSRISSVLRYSAKHRQDPMEKVKGLIVELIDRLKTEAAMDAVKYQKCSEQINKTESEMKEQEEKLEEIEARLDAAVAELNKIKALLASLSASAASAQEMFKAQGELRRKQSDEYDKARTDDYNGLMGVKEGLKIIRDFYADEDTKITNAATETAANLIVGLLEVIEQDLTQSVVILDQTETEQKNAWEAAQQVYVTEFQQNQAAMKSYEATLKQEQEVVDQIEEDKWAVIDILKSKQKILVDAQKECSSPAVEYKEKVQKLQAERDGLQKALDILMGETVLLQDSVVRKRVVGRSLRGTSRH